ncbi:MAG: hypothetical protein GX638_17880 [Crenarchaeota archaeon]|nr:hypothetical protein [Thermoproteota archaeon]
MKQKIPLAVFLIMSLMFISLLSIEAQQVNATYAAGVFCPNNYSPDLPPYGAGDTANETLLSKNSTEYIFNYLDVHYDGICYFFYGDTDPINPPNSPIVSSSDYYDTLITLEQNNDRVTIFSKGHCVPWGNGNHYKLLCTANPDAAPDNDIFLATNQAKCDFCFIWHCGTARSYPVAYPYRDSYGDIGMPFAFSHNLALSLYGSTGNNVYLGWNWTSPQFENAIPQNTNWCWAQFATAVFYYMHNNAWSIGYTLDYISSIIYGCSFLYSPLNSQLVVWGNMNMGLSY